MYGQEVTVGMNERAAGDLPGDGVFTGDSRGRHGRADDLRYYVSAGDAQAKVNRFRK